MALERTTDSFIGEVGGFRAFDADLVDHFSDDLVGAEQYVVVLDVQGSPVQFRECVGSFGQFRVSGAIANDVESARNGFGSLEAFLGVARWIVFKRLKLDSKNLEAQTTFGGGLTRTTRCEKQQAENDR